MTSGTVTSSKRRERYVPSFGATVYDVDQAGSSFLGGWKNVLGSQQWGSCIVGMHFYSNIVLAVEKGVFLGECMKFVSRGK